MLRVHNVTLMLQNVKRKKVTNCDSQSVKNREKKFRNFEFWILLFILIGVIAHMHSTKQVTIETRHEFLYKKNMEAMNV